MINALTLHNDDRYDSAWLICESNIFQRAINWAKSQISEFAISASSISASTDSISTFESNFLTIEYSNDSTRVANIESLRDLAIYELEDYKNLQVGWDGYFGNVFDEDLIEFMQDLTRDLSKMFIEADITPNELTPGPASDGSIDLEIGFDNKQFIVTAYPELNNVSIYIDDERGEREVSFPPEK